MVIGKTVHHSDFKRFFDKMMAQPLGDLCPTEWKPEKRKNFLNKKGQIVELARHISGYMDWPTNVPIAIYPESLLVYEKRGPAVRWKFEVLRGLASRLSQVFEWVAERSQEELHPAFTGTAANGALHLVWKRCKDRRIDANSSSTVGVTLNGGDSRNLPRRMILVQSQSVGAFVDMFMRGVYAMAETLDVEILNVLSFSPTDLYAFKNQVDEGIKELIKERNALNAVLIVTGNKAKIPSQRKFGQDNKVAVVTTGYGSSTVRVDNMEVGQLVGKELLEYLKASGPRDSSMFVLKPDSAEPDSPIYIRIQELLDYLMHNGFPVNGIQELRIPGDANRYDAHREVLTTFRHTSVTGQNVIVGLSSALGEGAATAILEYREWLKSRGEEANLKVFAADLTSNILSLMRLPNSPVQCTCGADPFAYGQFATRVAMNRALTLYKDMPKPRIDPILPILLNQDVVLKKNICNTADVVREFPALRLTRRLIDPVPKQHIETV